MIKVFDTTQDYQAYSIDGLKSGELCYVAEDKTAHFRTNNIDGEDKVYNTGGESSEPEWITMTFNSFELRCDSEVNKLYEFIFPANNTIGFVGYGNDSGDFKDFTDDDFININDSHKYIIGRYEGYKIVLASSSSAEETIMYRKLN